ncbi:MAG: phosphate/phosphite/phosphonate ABC transporter substrate-binding protein [Desulfocapsa sp.]|nr:phosphate/phosphite/phosphonate ABC transporter substrate-binding protein [Desulfocapsa sp.]MBN4060168.1 phosphate/phosphite/phosphonate ABC transporter substrate-binding protein [Desulfotalea psychrophila]
MKKIILLTLILVCVGSGSIQAADKKLSMLPRYFPDKLTAMITPLAAYLSSETGMSFEPVLTENFASYEAEVLKGNIAIGYENPLVYVNISEVHEVVATAVKGEGGDQFRGLIITRPGSGISRITALKGKKVMIVSKTSAGGFLSQKLTLKENGLDVERDCILSVAADNRQENVIISVSIGDVDAGFIRESALHKADEYIMPGSVKAVVETAWLPNWALSVHKNLSHKQKDTIQRALLRLEEDSEVLKAMNLKSFIAATDSDYDIIRTLKK